MLPIKGEFKDYNFNSHPEGFAFDVKNGVIYNGVYQNEEGTALHSSTFKNRNLKVIGVLPVKSGRKVFFSIRENGLSEIGLMESNGIYQTKVSYDLGFNINYPIDAEAQYNYKDELIIAFTDNLNTPKVINLDNVTLPLNPESIEMFPSYKEPLIDTDLLDSGGTLRAGSYQIYIRYEAEDGTITSASHLTNPIFITTSSQASDFNSFVGVEPETQTNKAIRIHLLNVDTSFKFIIFGVVSKINGIVNVQELNKITIHGITLTHVITGAEPTTPVNFSDFLVPQIYYKTIQHLTQVEGALYGANVKEEEPLNLQSYVNKMKLKWVSTVKDIFSMSESDKTHVNNNKERSFAHGEVYAFYIRFKLKAGGWTEAFTIPGRKAMSIDGPYFENSSNQEMISTWPYLSEDLSISSESRYFQTRDTTRNLEYSSERKEIKGDFGYWENQNEVYPTTEDFLEGPDGEDLRGTPVRHHRFPSQTVQARRITGASNIFSQDIRDNYNKKYRDKLKVEVDVLPSFPPDIASKIEGWELMYAERTDANATVAGEGFITLSSNHDVPGDTKLYNWGGNYTVVPLGTEENYSPNFKNGRFYSFDLLYFKSSLPTYFERFGRSKVNNTSTANRTKFIGNIAWEELIGDTQPLLSGYNFSLASSESSFRGDITFTTVPDQDNLLKVKEATYFPQQVENNTIVNTDSEEFIRIETNLDLESSSDTTFAYVRSIMNLRESFLQFTANNVVGRIYKQNVYLDYNSQVLVSTGKYNLIGENNRTIYGGDVFVGFNSLTINTQSVSIGFPFVLFPRFVIGYISENRINVGFRYEEEEYEGSRFFPKSDIIYTTNSSSTNVNGTYIFSYFKDTIFNKIGYSADFNSINNLTNAVIFNSYDDSFTQEDVHKIIRSLPANREQKRPTWKQFKANDYYIIPRNRGKITNIEGLGSHLFVNTEESLFITTGHEVLMTNESEVAVGTGDIFARPLKELMIEKTGYAGCQHKFSCILTLSGYFFIDSEKGKVYMSNGEDVKDISIGRSIFFRNNLTKEGDNPFAGQGYTVGFDNKYSRIILSKISGDKFTVSFTPALQSWTSSHDYFPNFLFNDRREIYGLADNEVFVHNRKNYGQYYRQEVKPFHIIGVINEASTLEKMLTNLNWKTSVYLSDEQFMEDRTFDSVSIWNRKQSTGDISLQVHSSIRHMLENQEVSNTRRKKGEWNFNSIRDAVLDNRIPFVDSNGNTIESNIDTDKEFMYKRRLIDTFFLYKLLFSNKKIRNLNSESLSPRIQVEDIGYKIRQISR